ncbi:MAG: DUF1338 family protein [Actinomycetota bacterium]|nr:DUF1338 family protein [Actinomycetota bacterium]
MSLVDLVAGPLGPQRARWLVEGLDLHPSLLGDPAPGPGPDGWVPRAVLAQALAVVLLNDLMGRVPSAAAYLEERRGRGEKVFLDHGAVRTVAGVSCGALPPGQESVTRVLAALGYEHRFTYDLARLGMTGRSWCHLDLPAAIPQYFVSELHADRFSPSFQDAAARVLGSSRDPLDASARSRLAALRSHSGLGDDDARALLPVLVACFARHHGPPALSDYQSLLAESEEMAWIATEGTAFNHATDRVDDVEAVAAAEREAGRPIKDTVEVSGSGRIRQTAHRAPLVTRWFGLSGVDSVSLQVPGSFFELITRLPVPDGSGPDLAFDAANAQQIFSMTRGGRGRPS